MINDKKIMFLLFNFNFNFNFISYFNFSLQMLLASQVA